MSSGISETPDEIAPPVQRVIARNTLWNVAGRAWDAVTALILTPYIVARLGLADYGIWGLVGAFTGYVGLLDLGLGSGYAKFIAEYAARGEVRRISAMISTALFAYAGLGVVLAAAGFPLLERAITAFASFMAIGSAQSADLVFLAQIAFALFLVGNCVAPLTSLQAGLQRMDLTNGVGFLMSLIKVAGVVYFLENGHGLRGLMYAGALVIGFYAMTSMVLAFYLVPSLRVSPRLVSRTEFRALFSYGWRAQVARLSNLITFETDIVIVSILYRQMGIAGAYKVGVELANKVRQLPLMLLGAIIPAASDLDARDDQQRLQRLYVAGTKYIAAVTVPLALYCAAMSETILRAWIGEGMHEAAWVFRILVLGYAINIVQGPGVSVALGKGRPDVQMNAGLIAMSANIVLTIALAMVAGYFGVAAATSASMAISMVWFLHAMTRLTRVGGGALMREAALWPAVASVPAMALLVAVNIGASGLGRLESAAATAIGAVVFAMFYAAVLRFAPFLDAFDAHLLEHTLRLRHVPGLGRALARARMRPSRVLSE